MGLFKSIGKGIQRLGRGLGEALGLREKKNPVFADPRSVGGRPLIQKTLEERIQRRGVGIPPERLRALEAAEESKIALQKADLATRIKGLASGAGLGRSTIPLGQIARGSVELDIASRERAARREIAAEELAQRNIENAIAQLRGQATQVQQETLGIGQLQAPTADPSKGLAVIASVLGGSKFGDIFKRGDATADPKTKTTKELMDIINIGAKLAAQTRIAI